MSRSNAREMKDTVFLVLFGLALLVPAGCVKKTYPTVPGTADGRYDSEFPGRNVSSEIGEMAQSVYKVYSVTYFKTYFFEKEARFRQTGLDSGNCKKRASLVSASHESAIASGVVILRENNHLCLLTCSHIFDYPDTVIAFYDDPGNLSTDIIRSVTFREKQEIYVRNLPECGMFHILARDDSNDLAFIGKLCEGMTREIPVFRFPAGQSRDLEWGTFVYILGYPAGTLMVTRGIISNPNSDEEGSFMIDALFNKGSSGSIVLALRDGPPHFELVGLVRSVSSKREYFLRPEKEINEYIYYEDADYSGRIRVGTNEMINYGVTYAVSIDAIREFYQRNRKDLYLSGYNLDAFLGAGKP